MTDAEYIAKLRAYVMPSAICPCCCEDEVCVDECTYATDCPDENATMRGAREALIRSDDDICGYCNQPGANKIPHPIYWPGEQRADSELVHSECEDEEARRAHGLLSDAEREKFLRSL